MAETVAPQPLTITGEALRGLSREELRARYAALPLPDTSEEHWRFTDLKGFDPDEFDAEPERVDVAASSLLDPIELSALVYGDRARSRGRARRRRAPGGAAPERPPAPRDARRRGREVRGSQRERLAQRAPRRRSARGRARPAGLRAHRQHGAKRLVVLAPARRRRAGVPRRRSSRSTSPPRQSSRATRTRRRSSSWSRRPSSSTCRSRTSPGRRGTSPLTARRLIATRSSNGSPAGSARRSGKTRVQNDLVGPGASARVTGTYFADGLQHLDYDTFQEHVAPNTTSDFAFRGVLRDDASAVWRGMIRVEDDAQRTNAYQENRNLILSPKRACRLDPRARDPRQRRALHARRDEQPGEPRRALLLHGARAVARRGRAADRTRLLSGHARPDPARAGSRRGREGARGPHPGRLKTRVWGPDLIRRAGSHPPVGLRAARVSAGPGPHEMRPLQTPLAGIVPARIDSICSSVNGGPSRAGSCCSQRKSAAM